MKCPNCQRENEPTSSYCIFCGSPLPSPEELQKELRRLRELVTQVNERLVILESMQGIPTPAPEPTTAPPKPASLLASDAECHLIYTTFENWGFDFIATFERHSKEGLINNWTGFWIGSEDDENKRITFDRVGDKWKLRTIPPLPVGIPPTTEPVPVTPAPAPSRPEITQAPARWGSPVTEAPSPPPKKRLPVKAKEREWEQILGGNWLARIGVLAIIIGAGFFLRYAFDKQWLDPTGRVILGISAGLAMLGGGHYWRNRYPIFAQTLSGGGIALLYLSIFAAFAMFELINFYLAVGLLLAISVTSAVIALRYNSMALAIIGIIGAFIAPFILAVSGTGVLGTTDPVQATQSFWLLVYVMVVDLGVLWLSTYRNWRWFTLLALLGSLAVFGVWYDRFGSEVSLLTSMGSLTIIFLIFVGATTLYHIVWRRAAQSFDYSLMVINAAAYFGISYGLLQPDLREWMGGFTLVLSLFYGGLAYVALKRGTENIRLSFFALGIALIFLTIAIPIQLGDVVLITIAWAAEGAVLVWLSFTLRMPLFRIFSYAVFAVMAVRLLFFDAALSLPDAQPFLNERFLAFFICIVATYLSSYLIWHNRESLLESERTAWSVFPIFLVAASLFVTVAVPVELGDSVWTTIAWSVEGVVLVWLSFTLRMPLFRIFSYAVFAVMAVRLLFFDTVVDLPIFQPVINERFLAFLVGITATYFAGYLIWRERKFLLEWEETNWSVFPIFFVAANVFSVWLLSAEVWDYFSKQLAALAPGEVAGPAGASLESARNLSLTALWALYAVILLVVGIVRRWRMVRLYALALLTIPIVKVFAYDVFALEQVYRIIAFVGLGVLLLISAYLYQRYSKAIKGFFVEK